MPRKFTFYLIVGILILVIFILITSIVLLKKSNQSSVSMIDEKTLPLSSEIEYRKSSINNIGFNFSNKIYYHRQVKVNDIRQEKDKIIVNLQYEKENSLNQDFIVYEPKTIEGNIIEINNTGEIMPINAEMKTLQKKGHKEILQYWQSIKDQYVLIHLLLMSNYNISKCNKAWIENIGDESKLNCLPGLWYYTVFDDK